MTQERRITDKLPTEKLVFTEEELIAAAQGHLRAESAAACLIEIPNTEPKMLIGVGTMKTLSNWLREDTASQSQTVRSELASLQRYTSSITYVEYAEGEPSMETDANGDWVRFEDVQSLFSHSAATGKATPDVLDLPGAIMNIQCRRKDSEFTNAADRLLYKEGHRDARHAAADLVLERADELAAHASPAAPLAGKAEELSLQQIADHISGKGVMSPAEFRRFLNGDGVEMFPHQIAHMCNLFVAPLAAAVPAEEASDVQRMARLGRYVTDFATKGGWDASVGEGAFEFVQRQCYQTGWDDAKNRAPAEPAPTERIERDAIQASALTKAEITEIGLSLRMQAFENAKFRQEHGSQMTVPEQDDFNQQINFVRAIEKKLAARLSTPTAQGTASRPNSDCSGEPSNCPDNEGYGCACGYGAPVAADAAVPSPSIDTPEFHDLLDGWYHSANSKKLVAYINRHIAAQAPAGRDAQQWISVDEREPEDNQTVAILYWPYNNHENSQAAGAAEYVDGAFYTHEGDMHHPPSHWFPIPAIPAAPHAAEQTTGGAN